MNKLKLIFIVIFKWLVWVNGAIPRRISYNVQKLMLRKGPGDREKAVIGGLVASWCLR